MKRKITVTEGRPQQIGGVRIDVRRKPRHKRQFVVMVEWGSASEGQEKSQADGIPFRRA